MSVTCCLCDASTESAETWDCDYCGQTYCTDKHWHQTAAGTNTECVLCEHKREDEAIIAEASDSHAGCDIRCEARIAHDAGLHFYAADFLVNVGADNGLIEEALERVDPDRSIRKEEERKFAELPCVFCESCNTCYYGTPEELAGMTCCRRPLVDTVEDRKKRSIHRIVSPHGFCEKAGRCIEHERDSEIEACR